MRFPTLWYVRPAYEAFQQGLRCLVDAHPTSSLGGFTIGADKAIIDGDVQTGLSQYWVHMR